MKKKYWYEISYLKNSLTKNKNIIEVSLDVLTEKDYITSETNENISIFLKELAKIKPKVIMLVGFCDDHIEYILSYIKDIKSIYFFKCPDLTNFKFLEDLKELEEVNIYWNRKATTLWKMNENKKLTFVYIMLSNKLQNFNGLTDSYVENLSIYGCNYLSSFNSNLEIQDLFFISQMKQLKSLDLHIRKTMTDNWYLRFFSDLSHLKYLRLPRNFFTFEEFALLSKALPNTTGLEPYWKACEWYCIIGKGTPKSLTSLEKAEEWSRKYEEIKTR